MTSPPIVSAHSRLLSVFIRQGKCIMPNLRLLSSAVLLLVAAAEDAFLVFAVVELLTGLCDGADLLC